MAITPEERQRRIESLKGEQEAIDKLNDLSSLNDRVRKEKPIVERIGLDEENESQKIASKSPHNPTDRTL